jgi:hypothetical protein
MAAPQVFDTTVLLEMILYKLPVKDLLFAPRITGQWEAVIGNSVKLQQAVFFARCLLNHCRSSKSQTQFPCAMEAKILAHISKSVTKTQANACSILC